MAIKAKRSIKFEVRCDPREVGPATKRLFDFVKDIKLSESEIFDIRLSFEEVLINAMKHGNRFDENLKVIVAASSNEKELRISVEDQGDGFDPHQIKDPTDNANITAHGGRGVFLVKNLMDEVNYLKDGRCVEIVKNLRQ